MVRYIMRWLELREAKARLINDVCLRIADKIRATTAHPSSGYVFTVTGKGAVSEPHRWSTNDFTAKRFYGSAAVQDLRDAVSDDRQATTVATFANLAARLLKSARPGDTLSWSFDPSDY